jgi:FtsH-binding integral membrane protein
MKKIIFFAVIMAIVSSFILCFLLIIFLNSESNAWLMSYALAIPFLLLIVPQVKKILDKYF